MLTLRDWRFSSAWGRVIVMSVSKRSERLNSSSVRLIRPLSILLMSSTSLMRESRWRLDEAIFRRESRTRSGSSAWAAASAVIPTMPFMGVRISWLIWERNCDLAAFARLASSKASLRAALARSSSVMLCVMSCVTRRNLERSPSTPNASGATAMLR